MYEKENFIFAAFIAFVTALSFVIYPTDTVKDKDKNIKRNNKLQNREIKENGLKSQSQIL